MGWSNDLFSGSLTLPTGATSGARIVIDGEAGAISVYDQDDILVDQVALSVGAEGDPGFIAQGGATPFFYAALSAGRVEFGSAETTYDVNPTIAHDNNGGGDPSLLQLSSGYIGDQGAFESAVVTLECDTNGTGRPTVTVETDSPGGKTDLTVTGKVAADNLRCGTAQTPAPGVGGGTSTVSVTFSDAMDATPRVTVCPVSTVDPGTVTIRWLVDNVTTSGFHLRAYRSTNSATNFSWQAISG